MSRERCCVGAQVTDLCRNVCDSYGDVQSSTAAGGDRGDNTARACVYCGSEHIDAWASWNVAGEWTCADCTPRDAAEDDL